MRHEAPLMDPVEDYSRSVAALLCDYSIEITARDAGELRDAAALMPTGTRVNITHVQRETCERRVQAARLIIERGLTPVAHISARRLASKDEFEGYVAALAAIDPQACVFVVGGDPDRPAGPYADSLALIESGLLARYGVRTVGVAAYPEGHPHLSDQALRRVLRLKLTALREQGFDAFIITQFGFDAGAVTRWLAELRSDGFKCPVRIGVPGPVGVRRLLSYARRLGVRSSAGIAQKYGFSLTNLIGTARPDRYVTDLATTLRPATHGDVGIHLFSFGGVADTVRWLGETQGRESR